jgi:hypothetical protein
MSVIPRGRAMHMVNWTLTMEVVIVLVRLSFWVLSTCGVLIAMHHVDTIVSMLKLLTFATPTLGLDVMLGRGMYFLESSLSLTTVYYVANNTLVPLFNTMVYAAVWCVFIVALCIHTLLMSTLSTVLCLCTFVGMVLFHMIYVGGELCTLMYHLMFPVLWYTVVLLFILVTWTYVLKSAVIDDLVEKFNKQQEELRRCHNVYGVIIEDLQEHIRVLSRDSVQQDPVVQIKNL